MYWSKRHSFNLNWTFTHDFFFVEQHLKCIHGSVQVYSNKMICLPICFQIFCPTEESNTGLGHEGEIFLREKKTKNK